ncbi:MAG: orotate phosphoribosyltransferase [Acidobacteriaceae bacterium]
MTSSTQPTSSYRTDLLRILATHSFRLGDFLLASGQRSDYYIDCRITTLHAEGGRLSGLLLYDLIRQHIPHAVAVGGLTMGADPLVSNTASASAWAAIARGDRPSDPGTRLLQGFLVRKAEKAHGTGRRIEGFLQPGAPVVIVDDVCTTGGSTILAIEAAREAGMEVAGVLCLVDRQQGGRARIEAAAGAAPFLSLFTADDIRASHMDLHRGRPNA